MLRTFLLAAFAVQLCAHDFWIQPSTHRAKPGELLKVRLLVGERGKGEGLKRLPERILRFAAVTEEGDVALPGMEGADPAGFFRPQSEGVLALVYEGKPTRLELPAAKFRAYLEEEGLQQVLEARQQAGAEGKLGRERFRRSAKALVRVGHGNAGFNRLCGLPLEFIPESDPFALAPGEACSIRLLHEGHPLAGSRIVAIGEDGRTLQAVTDETGRARLVLPSQGRWIFKAVHMRAVQDDPSVEWESLWASLTFQI